MDHLVESLFHWEGGSTQERFIREGSAPNSSPLPFCISFNYDRKSTPITYLVWNFAYIFNCCSDPMPFKLWINHFLVCLFVFFFYIREAQIRYSFWAEPPGIGQCKEYSPPPPPHTHTHPGYVSRIFPLLNSNKSLKNIHKETVSCRTLIVPIKVNQLPSYRTSKISLNEY